MLDVLADAVENLEVPAEAGALREVFSLQNRIEAKTARAVGQFDAAGAYELDGAVSMTAWMRVHLELTPTQANRILRLARRLRRLPRTAAAWEEGRLSSGQVEIIVANVTDRRAPLFEEQEGELVPVIEPLDIRDTITAMQDWAAKADAVLSDTEPAEDPPAQARLSKSLSGRGYLTGSFSDANTRVVARALRLGLPSWSADDPRSHAERQGQALVDVCRFFLDHQTVRLGQRHRPHLNVTVALADLRGGGTGHTLDGSTVDPATLRQIACDANVHRVITDGASSILDYGRSTRTIPPAVYNALAIRDLGCRFPGCDRPPEWCDGHHVWHWEDGGPTCLSNLVLLCCKHHHRVHLPGWHIKLLPSGTVEVTKPDGKVLTGDPPLRT